MHIHYPSRNQKLNTYYSSTQDQKESNRFNQLFKLLNAKNFTPSLKAKRILTLRHIAPEPSVPFQSTTKLFLILFPQRTRKII